MREKDILDEIIRRGKRHGSITYDEINDSIPMELFSIDRLVSLLDRLRRLDVRIVDDCRGLRRCL
jgi:RNA polymerase primary sigma factor